MKPRSSFRTSRIFAGLILFASLLSCFITAPLQAPDEPTHILRAYQVSRFEWVGKKQTGIAGGMVPKSFQDSFSGFSSLSAHSDIHTSFHHLIEVSNKLPSLKNDENSGEIFANFSNTVLYSPVPYLPQALGVRIATLFNGNALHALYLARIFNAIACSLVLFFSFVVFENWVGAPLLLFTIAGLPMSWFLFGACSADGLSIAFCFLGFSLGLAFTKRAKKVDLLRLCLVCVLISLCKSIYFAAALFPLLPIFFSPMKTDKKLKIFFALVLSAVLPVVIWAKMSSFLYVPYRGSGNIDPHSQLRFMIANPIATLKVFAITIWQSLDGLKDHFIGQLGWLDTYLHPRVRQGFIALLLIASTTQVSDKFHSSLMLTISSLATGIVQIIFICVAIYMTWNSVGADIAEGLQGRYFIPIAPLFLFYAPKVIRYRSRLPNGFLICFLLVWSYLTYRALGTCLIRFWG